MAFAVAVVKGHGLQPTLQGAIDCGIVLRKGTYPVVDRQSGCVEPVCDETPEIWRDVVRDLIEVYREVAETMKVKLYSVLLRGSVPKGIAAVDGTSDLDSLAYFVSDQPKNAEKAFRHWKQHRGREAIERCEQKHNIARRIEVQAHFVSGNDVDRGEFPDAFAAATQGVVVYGTILNLGHARSLKEARTALNIRADYVAASSCSLMSSTTRNGDVTGTDVDVFVDKEQEHGMGNEKEKEEEQEYKVADNVRWFMKRVLRAGMELCYGEVEYFSRDLLPCYEACVSAFPQKQPLLLQVLQIACGCSTDEETVRTVMRDAVNFIEDTYVASTSSLSSPSSDGIQGERVHSPPPVMPDLLAPSIPTIQPISTFLHSVVGKTLMNLLPPPTDPSREETLFLQDNLPTLAVHPKRQVLEQDKSKFKDWRDTPNVAVVYRGAVDDWGALKRWNLDYLLDNLGNSLDVLVSPSNIFTYCNESHPFLANGLYTPPSRRIKMRPEDLKVRLYKNHGRSPLIFPQERLYLQAEVPPTLLLRDAGLLREIIVNLVGRRKRSTRWETVPCTFNDHRHAQGLIGTSLCTPSAIATVFLSHAYLSPHCVESSHATAERVWLSTAGSVSSLHYDAADSFLCQIRGEKRVIFFPAGDLDALYCYPLGHPLGRRSRVDVARSEVDADAETLRHPLFWSRAVENAMEVVLYPGDVLFFPAQWAHYTESLTLSVSLTYRILPTN